MMQLVGARGKNSRSPELWQQFLPQLSCLKSFKIAMDNSEDILVAITPVIESHLSLRTLGLSINREVRGIDNALLRIFRSCQGTLSLFYQLSGAPNFRSLLHAIRSANPAI